VTTVVRAERVLLPGGEQPAAVHIDHGRITRISDYSDTPAGARVVDGGRLVVMAGVVDSHVHINEPGRTQWEGFASATRAAAAGGVTTLIDMPLNSIPATTTSEGFLAKLRAAEGQCHVDVGFWGGVVPGNAGELEPLARRGVLGFKAFLSPSGVAEFDHVSEADLHIALPILARLNLPLLVHSELPSSLREIDPAADPRVYRTWLDSRPGTSEVQAIELLIRLSRQYGTAVHIVHLACADALPALHAARAEGLRISVETCPHYLAFCSEQIGNGRTDFKCAPPIRDRRHQDRLWDAILSGAIDLVATDHSPAPPESKHLADGDFTAAWGGVASLQLGFAAVWTDASTRGGSLAQLTQWMSAAPAALAGLSERKGTIAVGRDADLVLWDPDAEWIVDGAALEHRHPVTPYAGLRLRGRVHRTFLRGEVVYDEGRFLDLPRGRAWLRANPANISQR
jgi:allantoinase